MKDIKESYGHMKSNTKAGDVEKSQVKIGKNPHQEILDKLMNRPFLKHKVMTSRSVKSFMFDIFEDGLKEDMVIFEPNFVKKYPQFSTKYLDLHFNYDHFDVGPSSNTDTDFLQTYDKIVQPRRWQKPYTDIKQSYSKDAMQTVFTSKDNQNSLFKEPTQRKPYEVFRCKPKTKIEQGRNIIMETLKHKINQQLMFKSDAYIKTKFNSYNERKQDQIKASLQLPSITFEEKKEMVIQNQKAVNKMKRAISEQVIKEDLECEDDYIGNKNSGRYKRQESLSLLIKNEMTRNSYHRYSDSIEKDINALSSKNQSMLLKSSINGNKFKSVKFPSIKLRGSVTNDSQYSNSIRQNNGDRDEQPKLYSEEIKNHIEITSIINSLYQVIAQIIKEKDAKDPEITKLQNHIEMAAIFLEKLYDKYDNVQNEVLQSQIIDVIERIDNLIYIQHEYIDKAIKQKEDSGKLKDNVHKQMKATLIQKLNLIEMKKNQLRNTSNKFKKYYDRSKQEQAHELREFLKKNNNYLKSNNNHLMSQSRFTKQVLREKPTQDTTNILNEMPTLENTTNDISHSIMEFSQHQSPESQSKLIFIQDLNFQPKITPFLQKPHSGAYQNKNIKVEHIDQFLQNEPSVILPSQNLNQSSPLQPQKTRRMTITSKLGLRSSSQTNIKVQNIMKKKQEMSIFSKLIDSKDFTLIMQSTDVLQASKNCLKEFKPYQYYDEVINEYFGGQLDLDHMELDASSKAIQELENMNDMSLLNISQLSQIQQQKQKYIRQAVVQSTLKDLVILAKEDAMTNKKAITSIENHQKNEKQIDFKQKQEKSTLIDYIKQLPNKKLNQLEDDDYLEEFYDYDDRSNSKQNSARKSNPSQGNQVRNQSSNNQLVKDQSKEQGKFQSLNTKMEGLIQKKYLKEKKKKEGFDSILFVQDLKMFHNEFEIPQLIDTYIKKYGANGDVMEFQRKNLVFYRKQLDNIEQKLIKLIQKFN